MSNREKKWSEQKIKKIRSARIQFDRKLQQIVTEFPNLARTSFDSYKEKKKHSRRETKIKNKTFPPTECVGWPSRLEPARNKKKQNKKEKKIKRSRILQEEKQKQAEKNKIFNSLSSSGSAFLQLRKKYKIKLRQVQQLKLHNYR